MYNTNTFNNVKMVDTSLVNKILEQGQKLRNAMVGSILKNDPFNTDIIYNKHYNSPKTSISDLNDVKTARTLTSLDEKRIEAYIRGEYMTKDEEKLALHTLRSMSAPDLCKAAERTLNSPCLSSCKCYTCQIYNSNNLYCDLRRKNKNIGHTDQYVSETTKDIQEKYQDINKNLLKYVDSLKISINNLILNEIGNRKVSENDKKVPYNFNQTYFLEYSIPDSISNKCVVSKSKVNSGLETNYIRLCSRRSNDHINFKQITIHDVKNLEKYNLNDYDIKFKISYRTQKQKNAYTLGFAMFNLGLFLLSKNLVCNRSLPVFLDENSPIVVGNIKVSLLLGCGKLYFGQEFIDAISSVKRDSVVLDSDDSTNILNGEEKFVFVSDENLKEQTHQNKNLEKDKAIVKKNIIKKSEFIKTQKKQRSNDVLNTCAEIYKLGKKEVEESISNQKQNKITRGDQTVSEAVIEIQKNLTSHINEKEKQILFGFLYISEVQYLGRPINTYITCKPFCQNETSCSKVVNDTTNPIFNFTQLVPLIYDDELLLLLRENFMVIEFRKKIDTTDLVIGYTKISLHQFYLAYRNPVFVKYLSKNKLPIIDTDWWEPIYDADSEAIIGQVQVLVALGTEEQINNLKSERGFTSNTVKAKFNTSELSKHGIRFADERNIEEPYSFYKSKFENNGKSLRHLTKEPAYRYNTDKSSYLNKFERIKDQHFISKRKERFDIKDFTVDKAVNTSPLTKKVEITTIKKFDVGTQSNLEIEKMVDTVDKEKVSPTQEMLGNFLNQLMAQRQRNVFVENSTNTEEIQTDRANKSQSLQNAQNNTNLELRKTTDLLDSLQKALSLDNLPDLKDFEKKPVTDGFRARISVNSANHLPTRKKCKSKKSKNKSCKSDDNSLPSCYVTFEPSEGDVIITPVVSKNTSPEWNFKCETVLHEDLLTNNQRRLIFKVWRKATNAVLSPNLQTDVILGFAAVDLSVLLAGFPNVQGWFNIIDFTGKCNGQINIHITPLENLSKYVGKEECNCDIQSPVEEPATAISESFSRALKRKFTELDEITQRLRSRLSKVTNDDSDGSSDGATEEFEKDINTLCIEEDFDLIDFEEEAKKFNLNHNKENPTSSDESTSKLHALLATKEGCSSDARKDSDMPVINENKVGSSNSATSFSEEGTNLKLVLPNGSDKEKELCFLDKHLQEGKQKIDTLLEKLSLISADTNTFPSRYVSGCSISNDNNAINIDTEAILRELDHSSRPNIQSSLGFDPLKFQQLYGGSIDSDSLKNSGSSVSHTSNSDTSVLTNFSEYRPAPDGQGNISDEKLVKK